MHRIAAVMAFLVTPVGASRLVTQADLGYNGINFGQTGTVNATIPVTTYKVDQYTSFTAGANATAGFLEWRTNALMQTMTLLRSITDPSADARAISFDILTPSGAPPGTAGFLVFDFSVSGSNSAFLAGNPTVGTSVGASHSNLVGCAGNAFAGECGQFTFAETFGASSYTNFPVEATFPIIYGQPTGVHFELQSSTAAIFDRDLVVNFSGSSEFGDTVKLTSVELLDANGRLVSNPGLTADSGTIYPLNGVAAVPEPANLGLTGLGCLISCWFGHQHRNRHGERFDGTRPRPLTHAARDGDRDLKRTY